MNTMTIPTQISKSQLDDILSSVLAQCILTDYADIDFEIHNVRVEAQFDCTLGNYSIAKDAQDPRKERLMATILDSDWDILPNDTVVFQYRLREMLDELNKESKSSLGQAREIRKDQLQRA